METASFFGAISYGVPRSCIVRTRQMILPGLKFRNFLHILRNKKAKLAVCGEPVFQIKVSNDRKLLGYWICPDCWDYAQFRWRIVRCERCGAALEIPELKAKQRLCDYCVHVLQTMQKA